ncbi:MAG: hypothetical protein AWU59_1830 [Methanolobus sp. T82-4]|nr:MAG: hypothetical protein AWU59_1830 [Methanolobus sp. T82-4]
MKYTFQDSTELPYQRDFINDLHEFIKISKELILLEAEAKDINETSKKNTVLLERQFQEIDELEKSLNVFLMDVSSSNESLSPTGIVDEIISSIGSIASKKKMELEKQHEEYLKTAAYRIGELNSKMLSIMNPFFEDSIYGSRNTYSMSQDNQKLNGKQISFAGQMEYWFELEFNNNELKVDDLYKDFSLPVWTSGGLLHREDKVKDMDLSDYLITSIEYNGDEHLEAVLRDGKSEHIFKIVADDNTFIIFYNDQDVTTDEDLVKSIDEEAVKALIRNMEQYFSVAVQSRVLTHVFIDGKDAISENLVIDCLKLIAANYGILVDECIAKGYNKDEITIKIERPDDTRTEKYISKADAFKQLSEIGSEGLELAGLLNVSGN